MKRIFAAMVAMVFVLCFSACSKTPQEHIDYFNKVTETMKALEDAVKQMNTALAAVDNTNPDTLPPLLDACQQVQNAAQALEGLSAPEKFAQVQQLYIEAGEDISAGCDSYIKAYSGLFEQDDTVGFPFEELQTQAAQHMASAAEKLTQAGKQHKDLMNT